MENFKLELTHQNGKKSELLPISFKYTVEDLSQMSFDLCSLANLATLNINFFVSVLPSALISSSCSIEFI